MYADYRYYCEIYHGTLSEEDFSPLAERASEYLDWITRGRAAILCGSEAVQRACCAVAELLGEQNRGQIASESVGNWTRSYALTSTPIGRQLYDTAARYLDGTNLLYRGC